MGYNLKRADYFSSLFSLRFKSAVEVGCGSIAVNGARVLRTLRKHFVLSMEPPAHSPDTAN